MGDKEYDICVKGCEIQGCYLPPSHEFHQVVANTPIFLRSYFYQKGREDLIEEVLDILKHNVLYPPQQSVNIFKKVNALKDTHKDNKARKGK